VKIGAIIPAAGYSSRMGNFKPLMPLGGQTVLARCAGVFQAPGIDPVMVITGHRAAEVEAEAKRLGLACIHNPDFDRGMFSSVQTAVACLPELDGFFFLPVDIPLVRPATIRSLLAAFDGQNMVYPAFAGVSGHPPLIPAGLIPAILAHDGKGGLQALLESCPGRAVPVWDRGILLDADNPEDFTLLENRLARLEIGESAEALALATLIMPERGVAHGRAVAGVAVALGRALHRCGLALDLDLIHNAALLHDVAKNLPRHEIVGAEMLQELGLGRVAGIVAGHKDALPPESGLLTEKEIVYLADKLIRGSRRVSVLERFTEKLDLYASDAEACTAIRRRLGNALTLQSLVAQSVGEDIETVLDRELPP
jgi:molybdenum cofactor cytidylyltransferase